MKTGMSAALIARLLVDRWEAAVQPFYGEMPHEYQAFLNSIAYGGGRKTVVQRGYHMAVKQIEAMQNEWRS